MWHMVKEGSAANYAFFASSPWILLLDRGFLEFEPHVLLFWPWDGPNSSGYWNERCHWLQSNKIIEFPLQGSCSPNPLLQRLGYWVLEVVLEGACRMNIKAQLTQVSGEPKFVF